jgi:hypothetical protein
MSLCLEIADDSTIHGWRLDSFLESSSLSIATIRQRRRFYPLRKFGEMLKETREASSNLPSEVYFFGGKIVVNELVQ